MKKTKLNANLIKKYHQELVYNYSEYPTKDNWSYEFKDVEYKKSLQDWLTKNKEEHILPLQSGIHLKHTNFRMYKFLRISRILVDFAKLNTREIFF